MLTVELLMKIFKVPREKNCPKDDLEKAIIFPPGCNESKISVYDGILAELDILHYHYIDKNITKLTEIFKLSEYFKHILPEAINYAD